MEASLLPLSLRSGTYDRSVSPQAAPQADETVFAEIVNNMATEVGYNKMMEVSEFMRRFRDIFQDQTPDGFGKYLHTRWICYGKNGTIVTNNQQKELVGGIHFIALLEKTKQAFQPDTNQILFSDGTLFDVTEIGKHLVFFSISSKFLTIPALMSIHQKPQQPQQPQQLQQLQRT